MLNKETGDIHEEYLPHTDVKIKKIYRKLQENRKLSSFVPISGAGFG